MRYTRRLIDDQLEKYFSGLPAISIDGAKSIGKTMTASRYVKQILRLDVDEGIDLMSGGLSALRAQQKPLLIDEWQKYPKSWDYVRRLVDEDYSSGQFLLTGSAIPRHARIHTGAGRIVRLRMRPMSLAERGLESPCISLDDLLSGKLSEVSGRSSLELVDYLEEITSSGFPEIRLLSEEIREIQLDSYIANIVDKEFPDNEIYIRKPEVLIAWLRSYAAATGTVTSYNKILNASTPGESNKPSKVTTQTYRDALDDLWITDRVLAWMPTNSPFSALGKAPKHYLADPALSARLLRVSQSQLLKGAHRKLHQPEKGTVMGRLFEALVALSLQTYAQTIRADLRHFRSNKGDREIDFIVERDFDIVAIEVKIGIDVDRDDVEHLNWLEETHPSYNITKVVLNTGEHAYTRLDGVHVIPAVLLGI